MNDPRLRDIRLAASQTTTAEGATETTGLGRSRGARWIILIGVGKYADATFEPLPGVLEDANRLNDVLHGYSDGDIADTLHLFNEQATRDQILSKLREVAGRAIESDQVVIYFGGHGAQVWGGDSPMPDGFTRYLLPHDADRENLPGTAISTLLLMGALSMLRAGEVVLLLDCCHAAGLSGVFWQDLAMLQQGGRSRFVVAAASPVQLAIEGDAGGLFTQHFCDGLEGRALGCGGGRVSVAAAAQYAEERVGHATRELRRRQQVTMWGMGTSIYLTVGAPEPAPERTLAELHEGPRVEIARLPYTGEEVFGRERELEELNAAWDHEGTNVISFVAWGGVGKSALVNYWLARMAEEDWRGAERVYAWSFFSQGTSDERSASAEGFVADALRWFGDPDPTLGTPWEKGERLARLVGRRRCLLLLDGLEPLQHPPGPDAGRIRDQSLQALLRHLAAENRGLCVISTRHPVTDLDAFRRSTAPRIDLEHLNRQAGAALLRNLNIRGSDSELEAASEEFGGHALALNLLGTFLRDVHHGDVSQRNQVRILEEDAEQGGHARRMMASYEKWFGEGPEVSILRLIGLFDRPADREEIAALRRNPPIENLTDRLAELSGTQWQRALSRLRQARLIAEPDPNAPDTIDAHPLVREHFSAQLSQHFPEAWRQGHERLYNHLITSVEPLPEKLEGLLPLYAAVAHGCRAGLHREALRDVFMKRILRGEEFFSIKRLGAIGTDLTGLANFFVEPWSRPHPGFTERETSWVLNHAAFDLRALGRMREAAEPLHACMEMDVAREDWLNASIAAGSLSELYLVRGELARSVELGRRSVELADRSTSAFQRMGNRTTLADALSSFGEHEEAERLLLEAEDRQQWRQIRYPLLYSIQGERYCDFFLGRMEEVCWPEPPVEADLVVRCHELQERAETTLSWAAESLGPLASALDLLSLGRSHLLEALFSGKRDFTTAEQMLDRAVSFLRAAATQHHIPRGLLYRARVRRYTGRFAPAHADLDEVMEISSHGEMRLFEADCLLERARLLVEQHRAEANPQLLPQARDHARRARDLVGEMHYHRRLRELAALEAAVAEG